MNAIINTANVNVDDIHLAHQQTLQLSCTTATAIYMRIKFPPMDWR
jgi:hypothetical protein